MSLVDVAKAQAAAEASKASAVLHIALTARRVQAALQTREGWQCLDDVAIEAPANGGERLDSVVTALAQLQQLGLDGVREIRVLVSDVWLATASLPWSTELHRAHAVAFLARAALLEAGCALGEGDVVRVDDAPYGAVRGVIAYPGELLAALEVLAQLCQAPLRSVRSLSSAAWELPLRTGASAMAFTDDDALVVAVGGRRIGEWHVRRSSAPAQAPIQALQALWQRLRLRESSLADIDTLPVVALEEAVDAGTQAAGLSRVDVPAPRGGDALSAALRLTALQSLRGDALDAVALRPAIRARAWWPAAAAGLAACAMVVTAWQSQADAAAARRELAAAEQSARPVAVKATPWSRDELARVRAVNQAVRELNLPIGALLGALQPPRDVPVTVLGVDVGGSTPSPEGLSTLRIVAEAPDAVDMTRYVAYVAAKRPLENAYLLRHELTDKGAAQRRYRFTVEASWRE